MFRIGGTRGLLTSPLTGKITALRMASRESESARGGGGRGGDDGFTMCVSVAVETTGWHPAQNPEHSTDP